MDSKGVDRGVRHQQSSESPPTLPSPLPYSSGFAADDIHNRHRSGIVLRRSPSPSSSSEIHKSNKLSKGESPVERRRKKRSQSRSSSTRSHRRSRSRDKDKNREVYKERSRKHSRRDRFSRSGSRERSRSNERRRSRSRNKSRDRFRHRDSRRHHRTVLYESDALQEDVVEPVLSQPYSSMQSNAFKNDGSFMEMFKKMQEQMQPVTTPQPLASSSFSLATSSASILYEKTIPPPPLMVGKRRGGRILKTGMVAKPKSEPITDQPKDAWSLYMAEVKKYREVCCQEEDNTRPLQTYRSTMPEAILTADKLQTAPFDPRFPNQNQTRHCWHSFVDFHRCQKARGEDYEPCQYFKKVYTSLCPNAWIEKWNDQLEAGTFPGRI